MTYATHADVNVPSYTVPHENHATISALRSEARFPADAWFYFRLHSARAEAEYYGQLVPRQDILEILRACMRLASLGIVQEHHARAWCNGLARGVNGARFGHVEPDSFLDDFIVPTPHELRRALSRMAEAEAMDELSVLARELSDARATLRQAQIALHEAKAAQRR